MGDTTCGDEWHLEVVTFEANLPGESLFCELPRGHEGPHRATGVQSGEGGDTEYEVTWRRVQLSAY